NICDVEVDVDLGIVRVIRYPTIQDVGHAIPPGYVEGQLQGGAVQGIGWALNEEYIYNKEGKVDNPGFLDYRMPVCSDMPMIDCVLVEVPNPKHPQGVKGVGEVPLVPVMAAVANAVHNALGIRFYDLPLSPPRVSAALDAQVQRAAEEGERVGWGEREGNPSPRFLIGGFRFSLPTLRTDMTDTETAAKVLDTLKAAEQAPPQA